MSEPPVIRPSAARIAELHGLDSVHDCRMRLVSIRTRIETNWPSQGGFLRRSPGLDPEIKSTIAGLLVALPSPLPLEAGGQAVPLLREGEVDLRAAAGRAVDAAMALLEGGALETIYNGDVALLQDHRPGTREAITVSAPTVGLLVSIIIGTLEAIVELIRPTPGSSAKAASQTPKPNPSRKSSSTHKG